MTNAKPASKIDIPPRRSVWSILVLLALVLSITAQLVTGFAMMIAFSATLLITHVSVGVAAIGLTVAEWLSLLATAAGRYRLRRLFTTAGSPAEWSEGAFLVAASITVVLGALVASILYLGAQLPFGLMLLIHQSLATVVAALYVVHVVLALHRAARRKAAQLQRQV